mmetsp:Transcript_14060/g.19743  ORF Transcript_14060/g.19743 Transcript_14060/m.19743 type:complete len:622 (-) Transcript_14060:304-2169(-)
MSQEEEDKYGRASVPLVELELRNITYAPITATASGEKKRKVVLSNISTKVSPFQLSAWMGPSGSGKTSLISVAAGLNISSGDLLQDSVIEVNGTQGRIPKRLVGVVWQDDLLLSNLTVQECIYFSARLKTPLTISDADVRQLVKHTIDDLGLSNVQNSLIGNMFGLGAAGRGISGGERKRVSVACELVVRPSVLFLDEPTSGLDATSAQSLVKTLKDLAQTGGHAIAMVVHQPRTAIFEMLDNLLLLSKGNAIYNGSTKQVRSYLESCPDIIPLPPETGIADWIMDTIIEDEHRTKSILPENWKQRDQVDAPEQQSGSPTWNKMVSSLTELQASPKYETSFWTQLSLLTRRFAKQRRGEHLTRAVILTAMVYTILVCLFWFRIPDDTSRVYERNSVMFFMLIAQSNGIAISGVATFQREKALLFRERAKKMYGTLPYFLAMTSSEMTNNVLLPLIHCAVTYWVVNLRPTAVSYIQFLIAMYSCFSTAQALSILLSVSIPNVQIALMLAPAVNLFSLILGGFYIPFENMRRGISSLSWISYARYGYSAMLVNEYSGRMVPCAKDGVSVSIGESNDCPISGDDILESLGIEGLDGEYWFNIGMIVALQVFLRLISYFLLRRSR